MVEVVVVVEEQEEQEDLGGALRPTTLEYANAGLEEEQIERMRPRYIGLPGCRVAGSSPSYIK